MKKLFFALITSFLFVATAWGQCPTETHDNVTLGDMGGGFNWSDKSKEFTTELNAPVVSFDYAAVDGTTWLSWRVDEYTSAGWVQHEFSTQQSGSDRIPLSKETRRFRLVYSGNFQGTYSNIIVRQGSYLEIPKAEVDFGRVINKDNVPSRTIRIAYSSISENLTAELTKKDGIFTISTTPTGGTSTGKVTLAQADCSYGSTTLYINFKPQNIGNYSDVIKFSDGTQVTIKGTYTMEILSLKNTSYTSATLSWERVPGATAYQIRNLTTGATYDAEYNDTYLTVTGLKMGSTYEFVLYPIYNGTISPICSNSVYVTTLKEERTRDDNCVAYQNSEEYSFKMQGDYHIDYDIKTNNTLYSKFTRKVSFQVRKDNLGIALDPDIYMTVQTEGGQHVRYWQAKENGVLKIDKNWKTFEVEIPHNVVSIKFNHDKEGTYWRYVKNLTVYRDNVLSSYNTTELDFGEVELGKSKTLQFKLAYANATELFKHIDSEFFTISDNIKTGSCQDGDHEVTVTFTPTECRTDYTASLTIYNGKELSITLKGKVKKSGADVEKIIWNGSASTEWDNRDNWNKTDGTPLTCADNLSEDLTVTIPGGLAQYPIIPDVSSEENFYTKRNNDWNGNQVNAGDNASATMIAKTIVLEYGASIVGVETLYNPETGIRRYHEVENRFDARRKEWLLVGTVVKPWDESGNGEVRNILSKDYYLNGLPHVYMREAVVDENNDVTWKKTFSELNKEVPHNKAFAIYIINEYGPNSWTAKKYDKEYGTSYAETLTMPNTYTYTGHFFNESSVIKYEDLTPLKPAILCNTYPAPIDAYALNEDVDGTIQYYDYTSKSFKSATEGAVIMPQNGFVFTPNQDATSITIDAKHMKSTAIKNRSVAVEPTLCRIKANNAARSVSSEISIRYDEYKEEGADFGVDAPKLFAKETASLPDIYVMRYGANWAGITISDMIQPIPLGVTINSANQTFTIEMTANNMPFEMVLEDRTTATLYNLSNGEVCTVSGLAKGDYKGRFYLYAVPIESDDDNVTTNIDVNAAANSNIDIFTQENSVIVSATNQTKLQSIMVSDMVGRSTTYTVNGQYYEIMMPESRGIYMITAVGDAGIVTRKVRM